MIEIPGIKAPERSCSDPKCPWHGQLSVRGKLVEGEVVSDKMKNTVVVKWEFIKKRGKYERFVRKTAKVAAHNPECVGAKEGDKVMLGECRRLSKTKQFVVLARKGGK